jgi:hypothetical protein
MLGPRRPYRIRYPVPWGTSRPATDSERGQVAEDLERLLADREIDYQHACRVILSGLYALSGREAMRVVELVVSLLRVPDDAQYTGPAPAADPTTDIV